jgi:hypothetical protein
VVACRRALDDVRTATFTHGAYIIDPLRAIQTICGDSILGFCGDGGGGCAKLGVTYQRQLTGESAFLPIVLVDGSDHHDELARLYRRDVTPFVGESAAFDSIFDVCQHLFRFRPKIYLGGDWAFLNGVLGLKNASSRHPCPICQVKSSNLLDPTAPTKYRTDESSPAQVRTPFL